MSTALKRVHVSLPPAAVVRIQALSEATQHTYNIEFSRLVRAALQGAFGADFLTDPNPNPNDVPNALALLARSMGAATTTPPTAPPTAPPAPSPLPTPQPAVENVATAPPAPPLTPPKPEDDSFFRDLGFSPFEQSRLERERRQEKADAEARRLASQTDVDEDLKMLVVGLAERWEPKHGLIRPVPPKTTEEMPLGPMPWFYALGSIPNSDKAARLKKFGGNVKLVEGMSDRLALVRQDCLLSMLGIPEDAGKYNMDFSSAIRGYTKFKGERLVWLDAGWHEIVVAYMNDLEGDDSGALPFRTPVMNFLHDAHRSKPDHRGWIELEHFDFIPA